MANVVGKYSRGSHAANQAVIEAMQKNKSRDLDREQDLKNYDRTVTRQEDHNRIMTELGGSIDFQRAMANTDKLNAGIEGVFDDYLENEKARDDKEKWRAYQEDGE